LDGKISNDLLTEFSRGYPIENLKRLIYSELLSARGTAAFISTELGVRAAPVLRDIASLLEMPTPRARYDALESLWMCATFKDGWAIGAVLQCLDDPWPGVRWGAINAVRIADRRALLAGCKYLKTKYPESVYSKFGSAFLRIERGKIEVLESLLAHEDSITRRFAVGLAARPRLVVDEARLLMASGSSNEEISELACQLKDNILPPWATLSSGL
jgi:hypothetical protein